MQERILEELLDEVSQIRKLLTIVFTDRISEALTSKLSTKGRKDIWRLLDGKRSTSDIAEQSGTSLRTVQAVVKELRDEGLVSDGPRGNPKRVIDVHP